MRGMRHPLSGAIYEIADGGVQVSHRGRIGVYDNEGRWRSGDVMTVCPNMCRWIGNGPRVPVDLSNNRRFRSVPARSEASS